MMRIHLLVLNYNGRALLEECLPSVVEAAHRSRHACEVAVIDNASTDDSVAWLEEHYPQVEVIQRANRGLCSFNEVVAGLEGQVAILLNNDIKLEPDAIDPWVAPLDPSNAGRESDCFMTAPLCWRFDGGYEGFRTAVRWRWGLVQATALFPGHEAATDQPGWTASAGAALAVDCDRFTALGGFDPLYLPGRLEDLDFALRGYLAGYHARYVPEAVVWHLGMATFGRVFGATGCDQLALRNTLLFQWKNLRHPAHLARQMAGLPLRLLLDVLRAPWAPKERRWTFVRALAGAIRQVWNRERGPWGVVRDAKSVKREREFFERFSPRLMRERSFQNSLSLREMPGVRGSAMNSFFSSVPHPSPFPEEEGTLSRDIFGTGSRAPLTDRHQDWAYPVSRWYVRPLADRVARWLVPTPVRPNHLTLAGLLVGLCACGLLVWQPAWTLAAGILVLVAWFFDRTDGLLARQQGTASPFGAWLDGNVDELLDVSWHVAAAAALAATCQATWPWLLALAFVAGKYLFMHSLAAEEHFAPKAAAPVEPTNTPKRPIASVLRAAWHLPGNADVRIHLLMVALVSGYLVPELAFVAAYYSLRWIVRFGLVARRLGGRR